MANRDGAVWSFTMMTHYIAHLRNYCWLDSSDAKNTLILVVAFLEMTCATHHRDFLGIRSKSEGVLGDSMFHKILAYCF